MADLVFNSGLDRIAINASQATGFDAARYARTISVDDSGTAFTATDTTAGSPANFFDKALTGAPAAPAGQTVTHEVQIDDGEYTAEIVRIILHDDTTANVTGSSTTLVAGVDGQSITTTGLDVIIKFKLQYASA